MIGTLQTPEVEVVLVLTLSSLKIMDMPSPWWITCSCVNRNSAAAGLTIPLVLVDWGTPQTANDRVNLGTLEPSL